MKSFIEQKGDLINASNMLMTERANFYNNARLFIIDIMKSIKSYTIDFDSIDIDVRFDDEIKMVRVANVYLNDEEGIMFCGEFVPNFGIMQVEHYDLVTICNILYGIWLDKCKNQNMFYAVTTSNAYDDTACGTDIISSIDLFKDIDEAIKYAEKIADDVNNFYDNKGDLLDIDFAKGKNKIRTGGAVTHVGYLNNEVRYNITIEKVYPK